MTALHPVTTAARNLRHYARTLKPGALGGNWGYSLCHEFGVDQGLVDAEEQRGKPGAVIADLRACSKCEQAAERLGGGS